MAVEAHGGRKAGSGGNRGGSGQSRVRGSTGGYDCKGREGGREVSM